VEKKNFFVANFFVRELLNYTESDSRTKTKTYDKQKPNLIHKKATMTKRNPQRHGAVFP